MKVSTLSVLLMIPVLGVLTTRADYYVAQNDQTPVSPYTNWTDAASNIQDVVDVGADNSTIWVGAGHYVAPPAPPVYNGATNVVVMNGIRFNIRGASGDPADVIIDGEGKHRGIGAEFTGWDAEKRGYLFDSLTISNCLTAENGGAIRFRTASTDRSWTGRVENCVITHNAANLGAGVYFVNDSSSAYPGLIVSNSVIRNNHATTGGGALLLYRQITTRLVDCLIAHNQADSYGGALYTYMLDALIERCVVHDNRTGSDHGLFFFYASNTDVRNSLFHNNDSASKGILNLHDNGTLDVHNCTIVSNTYGTAGAVNLRAYNGGTATVVNCVIYSNIGWAVAGTEGEVYMTNSCAPSTNKIPDFYAAGNITNAPRFADFAARNFRMHSASPCVNTGTNLEWMAGAIDLDGTPRIDSVIGIPDMGAYEYAYQGTLIMIE